MRKFKDDPEGVEQAVTYLEEIGEYWKIADEQSTDGWTIIALANSIYRKRNENWKSN